MDGGNPYARMVAVMRGEAGEHSASRSGLSGDQAAGETNQAGLGAGPVKMRLGTVVRRKPLEIMVAGTRQPAEVFKINERLTKGAKWETALTAPGDGLFIGQAEQEQLEIALDEGDRVLLLTEDDQVFYILMKVVDAV